MRSELNQNSWFCQLNCVEISDVLQLFYKASSGDIHLELNHTEVMWFLSKSVEMQMFKNFIYVFKENYYNM